MWRAGRKSAVQLYTRKGGRAGALRRLKDRHGPKERNCWPEGESERQRGSRGGAEKARRRRGAHSRPARERTAEGVPADPRNDIAAEGGWKRSQRRAVPDGKKRSPPSGCRRRNERTTRVQPRPIRKLQQLNAKWLCRRNADAVPGSHALEPSELEHAHARVRRGEGKKRLAITGNANPAGGRGRWPMAERCQKAMASLSDRDSIPLSRGVSRVGRPGRRVAGGQEIDAVLCAQVRKIARAAGRPRNARPMGHERPERIHK